MSMIRTSIIVTSMSLLSFAAFADEFSDRKKASAEATKEFAQKLGETMQREMKAGGPTSAVKVCSEMAPEITGEISRKTGWKVTRVGTRVRNTMLGSPDAWEQKVLADFQAKAAKGEDYKDMAHAEVVEEPNGKYFRFMKAIPVQQPCLQCHGNDEQVLPEVQMIIDERYPHDKARGYKVGDLRGAVSIKQAM